MFQNFFFVVCLFVLFFAFVKTSLCGKFKNFKTNKAILTIVIKRKSIMMKTLLGNISVQKKKNHSEVCLALMFGCGLCYLGQSVRSNHLKFFFLSQTIEKVMRNNLTNEMLLTSKYI